MLGASSSISSFWLAAALRASLVKFPTIPLNSIVIPWEVTWSISFSVVSVGVAVLLPALTCKVLKSLLEIG